MLYTRRLFNALQPAITRRRDAVPLSDNTLKEVIMKAIGKPTSSDEISYFKRSRKAKSLAPCFAGEVRPKLRLMTTAIDHSELPAMTLPEVAFYGRTNAGKSCLINALCGRFGVCTVKDLPGTTRKLHFYRVGAPASLILVDLPGYGYSSAKEDTTLQWNEFTLSYIKNRQSLKLVLILIDSRLGLKQSDLECINFCDKYRIRWQLVMGKADTVKPVMLAKLMHKVRLETKIFRSCNGKVVAVSATKNQNLDELRAVIDAFKVDKHVARYWSNHTPARRPQSENKNVLQRDNFTRRMTFGNSAPHIESSMMNPGEAQETGAIVERYDLYKYLNTHEDPLSKQHVVLESLADIFSTMTPPPGLVEYSPSHKEVAPVEVEIQPSVEKILEPLSVEFKDGLMFNVNVNIRDTLIRSEETETIEENLMEDKIASYRRRVAMGMEAPPDISKANIGRSYKRVLSLYKKEPKPKRLRWNAVDQSKMTWSAVYQKWEKWSRKHPELAGLVSNLQNIIPSRTMEAPTKRDIIAVGRKELVRKSQLQVHKQRMELRKGTPNIKRKQFQQKT